MEVLEFLSKEPRVYLVGGGGGVGEWGSLEVFA